ncbi:MAG: hypothetical protein HY854_24800 [Burkholderiales bacterium]|nr:hypothetical protein [Burkholderiales bacterium]
MQSSTLVRGLAAGVLALSGLQPVAAQAPAAPVTDGHNAYVFGASVKPSGPVQGDFTAAGGRVVVDQAVSGDVFAAGSTVDIRAAVGDDVRATAGDINIDAAVGGELVAAGGALTIGRNGSIARDVMAFAGKVTLDGKVGGRFEAHAERVVIDGAIKGDVVLEAEHIELGPLARIDGKLSYASNSTFERADGAVVTGGVTRQETKESKRKAESRESRGKGWTGALFTFLGLLAAAALLQLVAPAFTSRAAQRIGQVPWPVAGIGVAALIGTPVAAVVLCITLIGIPFALILLMLYPLLMLFGFLTGAFFLADRLPGALRRSPPESLGVLMAYVAVTLLLVLLLGRVPVVGGFLIAALMLLGMGAFSMELYARWRARPARAA